MKQTITIIAIFFAVLIQTGFASGMRTVVTPENRIIEDKIYLVVIEPTPGVDGFKQVRVVVPKSSFQPLSKLYFRLGDSDKPQISCELSLTQGSSATSEAFFTISDELLPKVTVTAHYADWSRGSGSTFYDFHLKDWIGYR